MKFRSALISFWLLSAVAPAAVLSQSPAPRPAADLKTRAASGDADAMTLLGLNLWLGRGVERDDAAAVRWFQSAAKRGNATAMFHLGVAYDEARGVSRDARESLRWIRAAADAGSPNALLWLGEAYVNGQGLAKDPKAALELFRRVTTAEDGHLRSIAYLGLAGLHATGSGTRRDDRRATELYLKSAELGHSKAMSAVGARYALGTGTTKDLVRALMWMTLAQTNGNHAASGLRDRIAETMTKDEIRRAEQRAREWIER